MFCGMSSGEPPFLKFHLNKFRRPNPFRFIINMRIGMLGLRRKEITKGKEGLVVQFRLSVSG
jgi:hypothetical protein